MVLFENGEQICWVHSLATTLGPGGCSSWLLFFGLQVKKENKTWEEEHDEIDRLDARGQKLIEAYGDV